ncbi:hypothetical protein F5148DRAFT_181553 [Russula earlei]|uniref:Uncharacterized protein n=1 Tax=Russula earlei TaxID=71964 RepID=A0ACC0UJS3_9AGAM|nr:hypothetical protein F5148DRAFT_181553 [Russula earlei]
MRSPLWAIFIVKVPLWAISIVKVHVPLLSIVDPSLCHTCLCHFSRLPGVHASSSTSSFRRPSRSVRHCHLLSPSTLTCQLSPLTSFFRQPSRPLRHCHTSLVNCPCQRNLPFINRQLFSHYHNHPSPVISPTQTSSPSSYFFNLIMGTNVPVPITPSSTPLPNGNPVNVDITLAASVSGSLHCSFSCA